MKKLCILLILIFAACAQPKEDIDPDEITIKTLTIRANSNFIPVIHQALAFMNEDLEDKGIKVELDIQRQDIRLTEYTDYSAVIELFAAYEERLRLEFMAGIVPDLMFNERFPFYKFSGYLTDIYTLMDKDDFFISPLKANEFRGKLYEIPMMFMLSYVGINDNVPDLLHDRFTQLSYISTFELLELYLEFLDNHPDEFFYIGHISHLLSNIMEYIDFDTNTLNLGSSFIDRLILFNRFDYTRHYSIPPVPSNSIMTIDYITENFLTRMFYDERFSDFNNIDAFFNRDIPFSHFIPITNDYGSLIVDFNAYDRISFSDVIDASTISPRVLIPKGKNSELAWEFTLYLIEAFSFPTGAAKTGYMDSPVHWGNNSFNIPIMRSLFESNMRATFNKIASLNNERIGIPTGEEFDTAVQNAIDMIYKHANMPMVLSNPSFHLPLELIFNPINDFQMGIITAHEAIARANNAIALWFMEQ